MKKKLDEMKMQVKFVAALIFAVFLLSLFARGHFNSGGRDEIPAGMEQVEGMPEGHSMCVLGEPGCDYDPAGLEVIEIPPQGGSWCPAGPDSCVEFTVEGGEATNG